MTTLGAAPWTDRRAAGQALAMQLLLEEPIPRPRAVIALPRGGVVVAAPVAEALGAPLYSWAVRKLALPSHPEVAIGALAAGASGPVVIWDSPERLPPSLGTAQRMELVREQWRELCRRQQLYGDPQGQALAGQWLVVVDDGIATGLTMRAALASLREQRPRGLLLAVPVADRRVIADLTPLVERLLVLRPVSRLLAVGSHYRQFNAVEDENVLAELAPLRRRRHDPLP